MKNTADNIKKNLDGPIVLVRGAGELATGVGWTLAKVGYRVVMTEVQAPLMVRWPVSFGTAMIKSSWAVEGITARRIHTADSCAALWQKGEIPILIDPDLEFLAEIKPRILIDAIMAKRNLGTRRDMAELTIGLGPGFDAGQDVDLVLETNRGHNLARLIYSGSAEPNTGVPGEIGGKSAERVLYSGQAGIFKALAEIGQSVKAGDILGEISDETTKTEVTAAIDGILRGLLLEGTYIPAKVKVGDIDPRAEKSFCSTISDKARALGNAALFAILDHESTFLK